MKHTISVSDEVYRWAQLFYKLEKPSEPLRGILIKAMVLNPVNANSSDKIIRTEYGEPTDMVRGARHSYPSHCQNGSHEFDPGSYSDPLPARKPGYCWGSGEPFEVGALICMRNGHAYLFDWVRKNT